MSSSLVENNKPLAVTVGAVIILFSILNLATYVYILFGDKLGPLSIVNLVLSVLTLVFALWYVFSGFRKEAGIAYKGFMINYLVLTYYNCLRLYQSGIVVHLMAEIVVFACVFTIVFAKDLGKVKSLVLCYLPLILSVLMLISLLVFRDNDNYTKYTVIRITARYVTFLLCSVIMTLMTVAKYADKAARKA